jgi:alpha-amylase/alpha-mannosidase (GH57 family)
MEWTILSEGQVDGKPAGAGPFWVRLPSGARIKVFVRDEQLSNDIAFNLGHFGGAGRWAREVLIPRKRDAGALTLIATDGETFGHHWHGEDQFLHWLLAYEALASGYKVTTLSQFIHDVEPQEEIKIRENTSWSCRHGLARWSTGCDCTPGDSYWKGAVRRAMDNLRFEIDSIYEQEVAKLDNVSPFALRNGYIDVILGNLPREAFLKAHQVSLSGEDTMRMSRLVEAQYYRQCMYASCVYFFAALGSYTTRYGIANAAYAIQLTHEATGIDLGPQFKRDLAIAVGIDALTAEAVRGSDIFDEVKASLHTS